MQTLAVFEKRFADLQDEGKTLADAKSSLDLGMSLKDRLKPYQSELASLKVVWTSLGGVSDDVLALGNVKWSDVNMKVLRDGLKKCADQLSALPEDVHRYQAWILLNNTVTEQLKNQKL